MQGAFYYLGEQRLGQGKQQVVSLLASDDVLRKELTSQVQAAAFASTELPRSQPAGSMSNYQGILELDLEEE